MTRAGRLPAPGAAVYALLTNFFVDKESLLSGLGLRKEDGMYEFDPDPNAAALLVGRAMADVERDVILATLRETAGNRTHAAAILCISIRTLRNKLGIYAGEGYPIPDPVQPAAVHD